MVRKVCGGLLCIALAGNAALAAAAAPKHKHAPAKASSAPLAQQVRAILAETGVAGSVWGISVVAMDGTPLFQLNDEQRFAAASGTKLLTTATAMALLGPQFTTTTRVMAPAGIAGGIVRGDLVLVGAGDTSMSARVLPYALRTVRNGDPLAAFDDLAAQVARAGVREVTGNVVGDDTYFAWQPWALGWEWNDLQWEYGAPVSALVANDNVQYLSVTPGLAAGDAANYSWLPQVENFTIESSVRTVAGTAGAKTQIGASRMPGSRMVMLWGTIPVNAQPYSVALAVDDPAVYAAEALKERLLAAGVRVDGRAVARHREAAEFDELEPVTGGGDGLTAGPPVGKNASAKIQTAAGASAGTVVASRVSPPLLQDLTVINKASQNLHAEMALMQIAAATSAGATRQQALAKERAFLLNAGLQPADFFLRDGSGLSRDDMVTARAFTTLLRYTAGQPWGAAFRATLPVGGVDGSLAERFTKAPLKGQVFAKTGTLEEDGSLSGFVTAASGKTVAFAILCNRHLPGSADRDVMDRVVAAIQATN